MTDIMICLLITSFIIGFLFFFILFKFDIEKPHYRILLIIFGFIGVLSFLGALYFVDISAFILMLFVLTIPVLLCHLIDKYHNIKDKNNKTFNNNLTRMSEDVETKIVIGSSNSTSPQGKIKEEVESSESNN